MAELREFDRAKARAFTQKALGDLGGTTATVMCHIGDRLGLFKALSEHGPCSSEELSQKAGINERYAREWLNALTCAGYLEYEPVSLRFTLPPEHAAVLAHEESPVFLGGVYHFLPAMLRPLDQLMAAFRHGGGVAQADYGQDLWDGLERYTGTSFENLLVQQWISAVPELQAKLDRGALVADVGCGGGLALIKLAQAFPNSRFVGFDAYEPSVVKSTANARAAGVMERVTFEHLDVAEGLPGQFDLVTTFDVVHDSVDPRGLLKAIHQGLKVDGSYLIQEINGSDNLLENAGPVGSLFYGFSVLYCLTSSLAGGGEGLGAVGLGETKLREFATEAGFSSLHRVWENPFKVVYEIKP